MDDEKFFPSTEISRLMPHIADPEEMDLKDYLFKPDPTKIRDISDFDEDTGWIPRTDRFGEYIGDGIVTPHQKLIKAVFQGFFEDLSIDSQVSIISDPFIVTFSSAINTSIKVKDVSETLHILCLNSDVLYHENEFRIQESEPWITTNLSLENYNIREKFLIQCFEIIRLTHLRTDLAERMKILTIISSNKLNLNEFNYQNYAVSLFYFVTQSEMDNLNLIECPIYYNFKKDLILVSQVEIKDIYEGEEIQLYDNFRSNITELEGRENALRNEFISSLNSTLAEKAMDLFVEHIMQIHDNLLKLFVSSELIQLFHRTLPANVPYIFSKYILPTIESSDNRILLLEDLRLLSLFGSVFIHYSFVRSFSTLYTILGSTYQYTGNLSKSLETLVKSHLLMKNRRDYVQLLFSYIFLLRELHEFKLQQRVLTDSINYLFPRYNYEVPKIINFPEYIILIYYINSKQILNLDTDDDMKFVMNYCINFAKRKIHYLPTISQEILDYGLELFDEHINEFGYDDILTLIKSYPTDILYLHLRKILYQERPEILKIIEISEYILLLTENLNFYSNIYPFTYNYLNERITHYVNLFVFYYVINEGNRLSNLVLKFEREFKNKLDTDIFQDIMNGVKSEESLEIIIVHSERLKHYIDASIIYYLNIKRAINAYFDDNNIKKLVISLIEFTALAEKFETYRPRFECLKLIYQIMLKDYTDYNQFDHIQKELRKYIIQFNLDPDELPLEPISDLSLHNFVSPKNLPIFLTPIR